MKKLAIRRFENKNVEIELYVFKNACYVVRTNLKEINPITNSHEFKCIKEDDYEKANSIFMNWVLQVNNIKIANIIL